MDSLQSTLQLKQREIPNYIASMSEDEIARKSKGELVQMVVQAREDIHILTQALAVNAADMGLENPNDLRSVLLYDLALSQQARAALAIDLARRTEKMKNLQKTVSTLSFVREANNLELLKCERRIKELEHQLEQQQKHVATASQSQSQLTDLVSAHHSLSSQLSSSQQQFSSSQQQISSLQHELALSERERDQLTTQISRLGSQYHELELQCSSMQSQHQQVLETNRNQHQQQLDSVRSQHRTQMDTAHEQATRREQSLQRELDRCHQQLAALREQHLKQIESEHGLREKREGQLQNDLGQLKSQHDQELSQLRSKIELMTDVLDKEKAKIRAEYEQTNVKLKERNSDANKQIEDLKAEIAKLMTKESSAQDKLTSLRAEYARQGRMNSFQEVVGAQMANVRSQLDEAKQMYERVSEENSQLASENARLLLLLDEEIKARQPRSPSPALNRPSTPPVSTLTSSFVDMLPPKSPIPSSPLRPSSPLHSSSPPLRPSSPLRSSSSPLRSSAFTRSEKDSIPLEPTTTTTITITTSPSSSPNVVSDRRGRRSRSSSNPSTPSPSSSLSLTPSPTPSPTSSPTLNDPSSPSAKPTSILRRSPLLARRQAARNNSPTHSLSSSSLISPSSSGIDSDSSSVS